MPGRPGATRSGWSWYRLADPVAARLVERAGTGPGDLVLGLGAGDGAITRRLAPSGARVVAFELHPERAAAPRRRAGAAARRRRVTVVRADVRDLRSPRRPFRVVANPPFDGVSALLVRLTS